jgi:hypothetical protein
VITFTRRYSCLFCYALVLIIVAVVVSRPNKGGKLYPTFAQAGEHFWNAEPLYGDVPEHLDQFRYSPLAASLLGPWHWLPTPVGQVLWRWLQAIVYLFALREWARVAVPKVSWTILALAVLPLMAGNIFNAQVNLFVGALLLLGTTCFQRERYNWAAVAIILAAMFKVYPLALGLLFVVLEPRRFGSRFTLALLLALSLPYVVQSPDYVNQQFAAWWERVSVDDRTEQPLQKGYHDFQKVLRRWGLPLTLEEYRLIEVAAGALFAIWLWCCQRSGWARSALIQRAFLLGSIWCTLFGPATESATYMLLAASVAHAVVSVTQTKQRASAVIAVWSAYLLMLSVPVALWFPRPVSDPYRALIPQAHAALLLLLWSLSERPGVGHRSATV